METTEKREKDNEYIIKLRNPITFEGKQYDQIDISGLEKINAGDMVSVSRRLSRNGNIDVTPEMSLEYALNIANLATGLPLEFFEQLPPYVALAIKGRVTSFFYRQV